jgi:hypothetical protein
MQRAVCRQCGDLRWSLFVRPSEAPLELRELCGGETAIERRRPGSNRSRSASRGAT